MQHVYKLVEHTLQLDRVRRTICPDGTRRTVQITGYDPSLDLYKGYVQIKKQRVHGYVQSATKINARFFPDPLPVKAHSPSIVIVVIGGLPRLPYISYVARPH